LLECLWGRSQSAKELAEWAGMAPDRLYYHLAQLEEANAPPFILSCRSREWQARSVTNLRRLYGEDFFEHGGPELADEYAPWLVDVMPPASATTSASSGDTTPPTAPTLVLLASSSTEIDITWSGATDNIGVTGYVVERCTGAGCSNFGALGSPTTPPFYSSGLTPNTTYIFRMRALDAAGNASPNSNLLTVTTPVASPDCD